MTSYDSDSSGGGEDYTETNVLLGYASTEPTGDSVSQLGGVPTWLDENPPSGELASCKVCNGLLSLLLLLNGDLPERFPGHERRLYIFGCRRKACRRKDGCVRGVRAVKIDKGAAAAAAKAKKPIEPQKIAVESPKPQTGLGETLFGVKPGSPAGNSANPFAAPASTSQANPFAAPLAVAPVTNLFSTTQSPTPNPPQASSALPETFASKLALNSPSPPPTATATLPAPYAPWPPLSSFPPSYPKYHLDADYETLSRPSTPPLPPTARMDLDDDTSGAAASSAAATDRDVFESSLDRAFQRFADALAHNPEQVLRYEFGGAPLLYSRDDAVGKVLSPSTAGGEGRGAGVSVTGKDGPRMPRCGNCGAARVFECQLTPHAITELEAEEEGLEGMDWGTVILGVCSKNCGAPGGRDGEVFYIEEWVGVQWEELGGRSSGKR